MQSKEFKTDMEVWQSLRCAIASSSGFKRWQKERNLETVELDDLVRLYLRETLDTLAY
ncbi:MAG: hypothetical protein QNJ38_03350 [Prochloraceae cyanobacterium]|nr:hypothetical protein [Prochloraceae cyanobacterium]